MIGAAATEYAREIARILITSVGHAMECLRNEILEGLSQQLSRDLEGVLEENLGFDAFDVWVASMVASR